MTTKTDTGKGLTESQSKALARVIRNIGKTTRPAYQGAKSYQLLPEER